MVCFNVTEAHRKLSPATHISEAREREREIVALIHPFIKASSPFTRTHESTFIIDENGVVADTAAAAGRVCAVSVNSSVCCSPVAAVCAEGKKTDYT